MKHQFTAGARRATLEAACWSTRAHYDELEAPALLLGLLVESECRAAIALRRCQIDAQAVRRRWPTLQRLEAGRISERPPQGCRTDPFADLPTAVLRFSAEVEASLAAIADRLQEYPRPLTLATEHLLLGLAAAEHEVAVWLRQRGIDPEALEAEIHRRHGHLPGPLPPEKEAIHPGPQGDQAGPRPLPSSLPSIPQDAVRTTEPSSSELPPREQVHLLRVLDAAANRGREGLRVVEDYVRFVLDDAHLTDQLKQLRHHLTALLSRIPPDRRLTARETRADVGTQLATLSERRREDTAGVLAANFTRLQESLRTLEEFGKVSDPELAAGLEQLRYRTYTLQRAVEITRASLQRLDRARLYVLIDGRPSKDAFAGLVRTLVDAGVHVIQLRDKTLDDRCLLERARLLRQITRSSDTLFVVNDRADLAALAPADGVHVGQEDLTIKDARAIVGPDALIGFSTHSIEQARQAVLDGANYIGCGPVFPSGTKQFDRFPGLELLRAVAAEIRLPAFAVGGITRANLPEVMATGFRRVAVSGAVGGAADPAAAARELLAALEGPGFAL